MKKRNHNVIQYIKKEITRKYLRHKTRENIKNFNQIGVLTNDLISESIFLNGSHEKEYLKVIKNNLSSYIKNKNVLDIGANIGTHTLFFALLAKKVYSFEPNKKVFDLLYLNTKNKRNVKAFNYGLSEKSGIFSALIPMDNTGGGSLVSKNLKNCFSVKFRLKKYTDILELQKQKIDLIKIDIEGNELKCFKGMKSLLDLQTAIILMEQKDGVNNKTSKEADFLKTCGYMYMYEFMRQDDWIYKKLPNIFPKFINIIFKILELLFIGIPSENLKLNRILNLTKNRYDLLLFSKSPIQQS